MSSRCRARQRVRVRARLLIHPVSTTEPPRLSTSHPIRRAFQAHGTATARHWLLSIVLTITISVLLCYQAVFQADSSAAAALRNLPKHVWTSTTQVEGDRPADVVVRQVWVHGDYMNAIALPVLREASQVQEVLIDGGFDGHMLYRDGPGCGVAAAGQKWGWHSPLMYWDCSLSALEKDDDLLGTINAHKRTRSALNITLRPSTVFAGKSFYNTKLRAADALVITLFDQTNSSLGDTWDARSRLLAEKLSPGWTIFPPDGQVRRSRLYEFRFKPMTLNDDLFLAASYLVTVAYVIWRMMQLRAVKSWFGLLVTICAKVGSISAHAPPVANRQVDDYMCHRQFHTLYLSWNRFSANTPSVVSWSCFLFWVGKYVRITAASRLTLLM